MKKDTDFRPLLAELIDLLRQQKELAENLLEGSKPFDKNGEITKGLQAYIENLEEQDNIIFNVAKKMEISFENDLYRKIAGK